MNENPLAKAIKQVAWGYLLLMFNFNLTTINIIPNWLSYLFFYKALKPISKYEKTVLLLKPLNLCLGLYEFFIWILSILAIKLDTYLITAIIGICALYFHFQLLTNITNIAKLHQCRQAKSLYRLSIMRTVLLTVAFLPIDNSQYLEIVIIYQVINFIVSIVLCFQLFDYSSDEKYLKI